MKILLVHPGHDYSTGDVFDGVKAGLEANGVETVAYDVHRAMRLMNQLAGAAVAGGMDEQQAGHLYGFANWLASGDAIGLAVDEEVDAVLVITGLLFPPARAAALRKLGIPVGCFGTEAPYFRAEERAIAPAYSHWFTNERRAVGDYADLTRTSYLAHAWNPLKHLPGPADPERRCDVAFIGGGFPERRRLVDGVDWSGIHFERRGTLWNGESDLQAGAIPNSETLLWHRSAAIALNLHRRMTHIRRPGTEIAPGAAESLGPRAYEIPAVGGMMLCDDERLELADVYGEAAATFRAWDSSNLERQVRYWLAHPDERERRRQAQFEAVQAHSWSVRARQLLSDLFA